MSKDYCIYCNQDGPLRRERRTDKFDIQDETVDIEVPVIVCPSCGESEMEKDFEPYHAALAALAERRKRKQKRNT